MCQEWSVIPGLLAEAGPRSVPLGRCNLSPLHRLGEASTGREAGRSRAGRLQLQLGLLFVPRNKRWGPYSMLRARVGWGSNACGQEALAKGKSSSCCALEHASTTTSPRLFITSTGGASPGRGWFCIRTVQVCPSHKGRALALSQALHLGCHVGKVVKSL